MNLDIDKSGIDRFIQFQKPFWLLMKFIIIKNQFNWKWFCWRISFPVYSLVRKSVFLWDFLLYNNERELENNLDSKDILMSKYLRALKAKFFLNYHDSETQSITWKSSKLNFHLKNRVCSTFLPTFLYNKTFSFTYFPHYFIHKTLSAWKNGKIPFSLHITAEAWSSISILLKYQLKLGQDYLLLFLCSRKIVLWKIFYLVFCWMNRD